ncbi:short-subunit dehydrogenase [Gelidibacter algens]|uniref:Short-subunit dehydrogenase n=1 Tax=Gelidibacter algens TaxID=49280 RepID=A0A1A7QU84_9FLAO|nr:SDR family oxidoreductase [Gelidibacter algens]OBX22087.1 short-chain dehydrogenase/reductase [Gelidibacter algens]RAJ17525.1 short-subunit dehydrogenase [Gelidibacter algens]
MKTALITGTSKGIGLETALAFGRAGYKVFATMRNPAKADDFKKQIKSESLDIHISEMDVDSDASVKQCINDITQKHGPIDVLVNNAGIERHGSVEELTMDDFKSIMETNYFGMLRCTKALLPQMRKDQKGCIINVATVAGHISSSPLGAYAASKFALEAVSEALAQEVKPFNIRVAIVEPGIINTQMANDLSVDGNSIYPHSKRFGGLFSASLQTPTPPTLVADKILEIAESKSWKLRHPVGPDAQPFIDWRASMNDEEWVDWNAANDDDWYEAVQNTFRLDAR